MDSGTPPPLTIEDKKWGTVNDLINAHSQINAPYLIDAPLRCIVCIRRPSLINAPCLIDAPPFPKNRIKNKENS